MNPVTFSRRTGLPEPGSWTSRSDAERANETGWSFERSVPRLDEAGMKPPDVPDSASILGHALGRPAFLPTPGFALRVLFGKVASILTTGQRVLPRGAERLGFTWRYPTLDAALEAIVRSA
jgi:hypothetical protein